jgi:hypothetical protein
METIWAAFLRRRWPPFWLPLANSQSTIQAVRHELQKPILSKN